MIEVIDALFSIFLIKNYFKLRQFFYRIQQLFNTKILAYKGWGAHIESAL